ncbi:MAG: archaeosortase/exosortase family protein [Bacteroidetes bacterium]|nr:archaeosortase/exosortase family protein [Bacteroidota bacterium]
MGSNKLIDFIKQPLILFLLKALLIWFGWMLFYGIIFKESQINDPMTRIEARMTAFVLRQMGYDAKLDEKFSHTLVREEGKQNELYISIDNKPLIGIASACNGVELFALFLGFLFAFGGRKKIFSFLIFGLSSIYLINLIRIIVIAWVTMFDKQQADFHHHYTFMFIVYGYILWLWHRWTIIQNANQKKDIGVDEQ